MGGGHRRRCVTNDLDALLTALCVKLDDELPGNRWTGRELEHDLGSALINRSHGAGLAITLTPFGRTILHAISIRIQENNPDQAGKMPSN